MTTYTYADGSRRLTEVPRSVVRDYFEDAATAMHAVRLLDGDGAPVWRATTSADARDFGRRYGWDAVAVVVDDVADHDPIDALLLALCVKESNRRDLARYATGDPDADIFGIIATDERAAK